MLPEATKATLMPSGDTNVCFPCQETLRSAYGRLLLFAPGGIIFRTCEFVLGVVSAGLALSSERQSPTSESADGHRLGDPDDLEQAHRVWAAELDRLRLRPALSFQATMGAPMSRADPC
jgi:hypothetical protein